MNDPRRDSHVLVDGRIACGAAWLCPPGSCARGTCRAPRPLCSREPLCREQCTLGALLAVNAGRECGMKGDRELVVKDFDLSSKREGGERCPSMLAASQMIQSPNTRGPPDSQQAWQATGPIHDSRSYLTQLDPAAFRPHQPSDENNNASVDHQYRTAFSHGQLVSRHNLDLSRPFHA